MFQRKKETSPTPQTVILGCLLIFICATFMLLFLVVFLGFALSEPGSALLIGTVCVLVYGLLILARTPIEKTDSFPPWLKALWRVFAFESSKKPKPPPKKRWRWPK